MTTSTIEFYDRVVYVALGRMTEDRATIALAFQYWRSDLAAQTFEVAMVVEAFENYLGLKASEKKSLFIAMQAATNRMADDLPAVPASLTSGVPQSGASSAIAEAVPASPTEPALHVVSGAVLRSVAEQVHKSFPSDFDELKAALAAEADDLLDDRLCASLVKHWADNGLAMIRFGPDVTSSHCVAIFDAFSMLVSEFVGPVERDRMVDRAISSALELPEAVEFSPRALLA